MKYNDELTERDLYMYHRGELREYIRNHGDISSDIRLDLLKWVDSGHEVHDNPWGIRSRESGQVCDYLEALRFLNEEAARKARIKAFLRR